MIKNSNTLAAGHPHNTPVSILQPSLRYWTPWLLFFVIAWLIAFFALFPQPIALLQRYWVLLFVGFFVAILANATAVGGGVIFIPIMLFVYHLPAAVALKLALGSQSFGMTSGAIGWMRRGTIPVNGLRIAVPALLVGSTISSLAVHPDPVLVKGLFGPASIFIGLIVLLMLNHHGNQDEIPRKATLPLVALTLLGGALMGWVAVGGGEIAAAILMLVYSLKTERGIGLGVVLLSITSIYLTLLHQFFLGGIPWEMVMLTGFGCVFGGRLGPYLSQWVGPRRLKIVFATVAIIDGIVFASQYLLSSAR